MIQLEGKVINHDYTKLHLLKFYKFRTFQFSSFGNECILNNIQNIVIILGYLAIEYFLDFYNMCPFVCPIIHSSPVLNVEAKINNIYGIP